MITKLHTVVPAARARLTVLGLTVLSACAQSDLTLAPEDSGDHTQLAQTASSDPCRGKPGRLRGKSVQKLRAGGLRRGFVYYAPPGLDADQPAPIVFVPHGYTMNGQQMFDISQYAKVADREGFVAIFPDGAAGLGPWNVGLGVCGNGAFVTGANDDQAFVDAMIAFTDADRCVDHEHIFMNGFSMGGYFSHESACRNPKIRAIAPHSAGTHDLDGCIDRKVPVLLQHFSPDNLISYSCGAQARDRWLRRNGCSAANPDVVTVKQGRCEYYKNCAPGAQVAMCTFNEPLLGTGELLMGHGWAGGTRSGSGDLFAIPGPESATEIAWGFFKKYGW